MNWFWTYIRRRTTESLLAGVHDALLSGSSNSGLSDEQAVKALRAVIGDPGATPEPAPTPQQRSAPDANSTAALPEGPRRGPGRPPRKFQDPPQE
jgi:hypothetical protein